MISHVTSLSLIFPPDSASEVQIHSPVHSPDRCFAGSADQTVSDRNSRFFSSSSSSVSPCDLASGSSRHMPIFPPSSLSFSIITEYSKCYNGCVLLICFAKLPECHATETAQVECAAGGAKGLEDTLHDGEGGGVAALYLGNLCLADSHTLAKLLLGEVLLLALCADGVAK